jgi:hypothetical protein
MGRRGGQAKGIGPVKASLTVKIMEIEGTRMDLKPPAVQKLQVVDLVRRFGFISPKTGSTGFFFFSRFRVFSSPG